MIIIWSLAIYLFVGVFYAYVTIKNIVDALSIEEKFEEDDLLGKDILEAKIDMENEIEKMSDIVGNKNIWSMLMLVYTIFWLPIFVVGLRDKLN